jgi:hypothetical protein
MGLKTKEVEIKWSTRNHKWYESKGYKFDGFGNTFIVKVEDLSKGTHVFVDLQCDNCNKIIKNKRYDSCIPYLKSDGTYFCNNCANKLYGIKN